MLQFSILWLRFRVGLLYVLSCKHGICQVETHLGWSGLPYPDLKDTLVTITKEACAYD
jgi:hypothetical protein